MVYQESLYFMFILLCLCCVINTHTHTCAQQSSFCGCERAFSICFPSPPPPIFPSSPLPSPLTLPPLPTQLSFYIHSLWTLFLKVQIPYMRENMQHLSFWFSLILFNMVISSPIYLPENNKLSFSSQLNKTLLCISHTCFIFTHLLIGITIS